MKKIIYRPVSPRYYEQIKLLIGEVWDLKRYCDNQKILDSVLNMYLHFCLLEVSFGKVAILDKKVVGVILGYAQKEENIINRSFVRKTLVCEFFKLLARPTKKSRMGIKLAIRLSAINKKLIKGMEQDFDGHIELLIVGKKAQGYGIGKSMVQDFFEYLRSLKKSNVSVYTDTLCNYRFYDSQGFKLANKVSFALNDTTPMSAFLYKYILD